MPQHLNHLPLVSEQGLTRDDEHRRHHIKNGSIGACRVAETYPPSSLLCARATSASPDNLSGHYGRIGQLVLQSPCLRFSEYISVTCFWIVSWRLQKSLALALPYVGANEDADGSRVLLGYGRKTSGIEAHPPHGGVPHLESPPCGGATPPPSEGGSAGPRGSVRGVFFYPTHCG